MADERATGQNADGAFYAMAQPLRRKVLAEALEDEPSRMTPTRHARRWPAGIFL